MDEALANAVQGNSRRYVQFFEKACDELLPAPTVPIREMDVMDVMQEHRRLLVEQTTDADVPRDPENTFPPELLRRL